MNIYLDEDIRSIKLYGLSEGLMFSSIQLKFEENRSLRDRTDTSSPSITVIELRLHINQISYSCKIIRSSPGSRERRIGVLWSGQVLRNCSTLRKTSWSLPVFVSPYNPYDIRCMSIGVLLSTCYIIYLAFRVRTGDSKMLFHQPIRTYFVCHFHMEIMNGWFP